MTRIQNNVYQVENCGGFSGDNYYTGENDDNYTDPDIENLDIYANLEKDYPDKRTETYRSGGTRGRLKGKSWSINYCLQQLWCQICTRALYLASLAES